AFQFASGTEATSGECSFDSAASPTELANSAREKIKTPNNVPGFFVEMRMASEVIVQPKSQVAGLQTIVDPGDRIGTAAEIHIEIFNFRRPVRRKAILQAETTGPTDESFAFV